MNWIEIAAAVPGEHVEALYAALEGIAPGGCSIEEPIVPLGPEEGVRREPWRPTVLRIYLPTDALLEQRRAALAAALGGLDFTPEVTTRPVNEEDWANAWKEFFQVEHIGRDLVIRPTWRDYQPAAGEIVLDLDPGMAFGTGQHETTRMCLVALQEVVIEGRTVLDLGCGSGILAVAAARLGAATVLAVDIDCVAVEATAENVRRNRATATVRVAEGSLGATWPFGEPPEDAFDVIVANIHAGALVELAGDLRRALRPGGVLIGSGVIAERLAAVLTAFAAAGLGEADVRQDGAWRAVLARVPSGDAG
jgi:ribosomal protein L11 methyltransferase